MGDYICEKTGRHFSDVESMRECCKNKTCPESNDVNGEVQTDHSNKADTSLLKKCPSCENQSLFWNMDSSKHVCTNPECRKVFTEQQLADALSAGQHTADTASPNISQKPVHGDTPGLEKRKIYNRYGAFGERQRIEEAYPGKRNFRSSADSRFIPEKITDNRTKEPSKIW